MAQTENPSPLSAPSLHYRTCPLCEATCGLELRVEGDQVTRIRGDKDDVFSRGFLCPKGSVLHHVHEDPDRLRVPLIKQPDGTHREATWDEAFAEIERLLLPLRENGGPDSTAVYVGNPNVHGPGLFTLGGLSSAVGTRNFYTARTVDQASREVATGHLLGSTDLYGVPDLERTHLAVLIGTNPVASNGSLATAPDWPRHIDEIRERGGQVVVIDPRHTETAQRADTWLAIQPGTDALLLAALVTEVFESGRMDLGTVGHLVDQVDEVRTVLAPFTAGTVADRTGLSAEAISDLARQIMDAPSAAIYGRVGLQTNAFGTLASWLTDVLTIVTGNLDREGGTMFPNPAVPRLSNPAEYPDGFQTGRWHSRVAGYPEAQGEYPTATLADEILTPGPGQVTSMICLAGNPVRSCPDSTRMEDAMASLDCLIAVDIYRNETTQYAHVILPPPSHLERSHYDLFFYPMGIRNIANWSPELFEPTGPREEDIHLRLTGLLSGMGSAADTTMLGDLTVQLIAGSVLPGADIDLATAALEGTTVFDRVIDLLLRTGPYGAGIAEAGVPGADADGLSLAKLMDNPHGIDLGPLNPQLEDVLCTPSGRIDLLPAPLANDLGRLHELVDSAPPAYSLIGRRYIRSNNSWMHNIRVLRKGRNRCTLMMHPDDAAIIGAADGQLVTITGAVGSVQAPAEITDSVRPGVVSLPHGYGHDADGQAVATANPGVNSNILTDPSKVDPLSGACSINGIPVELSV